MAKRFNFKKDNKYEVVYTITITIDADMRSPAISKAEKLQKKLNRYIKHEVKDIRFTLINEKYI